MEDIVHMTTILSCLPPGTYIYGTTFTLVCSGGETSGDWFFNGTDLNFHGARYNVTATFEAAGTYECRSSLSVLATLGVIVLGEFTALYAPLCSTTTQEYTIRTPLAQPVHSV